MEANAAGVGENGGNEPLPLPLRPPNQPRSSALLFLPKMPCSLLQPLLLLSPFFVSDLVASATQLILLNNCIHDIWPTFLASAGHPTPRDGGFLLPSGQETLLHLPPRWFGRIWARHGCSFHPSTGKGFCQTGDCAGLLKCSGLGGLPPATLVQITLGTSQSPLHFYDVSLVDVFNLPVTVRPVGASHRCALASCDANLNACCPPVLAIHDKGTVVACKSACLAAKSDQYCCTGHYADPKKCKPTVFARFFKFICPHAYSYAYDDSTTLKTCNATRYAITFYPPTYS